MSKNKIDDNNYEKILRVLSHFMVNEIEEIIPFESKSEEEREEILKVALKAIETSTIVMHEFLNSNAINFEKLNNANELIINNKYQEAYDFIFTNELSN